MVATKNTIDTTRPTTARTVNMTLAILSAFKFILLSLTMFSAISALLFFIELIPEPSDVDFFKKDFSCLALIQNGKVSVI